MPFTSPALTAKYLNSKVIFYDPSNTIDIKTYHGIKIIKTKSSLFNYFKDNLRQKVNIFCIFGFQYIHE